MPHLASQRLRKNCFSSAVHPEVCRCIGESDSGPYVFLAPSVGDMWAVRACSRRSERRLSRSSWVRIRRRRSESPTAIVFGARPRCSGQDAEPPRDAARSPAGGVHGRPGAWPLAHAWRMRCETCSFHFSDLGRLAASWVAARNCRATARLFQAVRILARSAGVSDSSLF
jgi:hypothetical protein